MIRRRFKKADRSPDEDRVMIWFCWIVRLHAGPYGDVIGGFNQFVTDQAAKPGKARLTAVQFDGGNPFKVIMDAKRIGKVPKLTSEVYQPSVDTAYDAVGKLIASVDQRIAQLQREGLARRRLRLVIVFTDGLENAAEKFDRRKSLI